MNARDQAAELRDRAISLLLEEREQIDSDLAALGHGQEKSPAGKKRGRPTNSSKLPPEGSEPSVSHSQTIDEPV
jgi:hypothetical protein